MYQANLLTRSKGKITVKKKKKKAKADTLDVKQFSQTVVVELNVSLVSHRNAHS